MGYTTTFDGVFQLDRPLSPAHRAYLEAFSRTRRMQRNEWLTKKLPDPIREAALLPVGLSGAYYVGSTYDFGQAHTPDIIDYNHPPFGQPGLWCQWIPTSNASGIKWDGKEKFYDYTEWLQYLLDNFLKPWGYVLGGEVTWQGEDSDDRGTIHVKDNRILEVADVVISPEPNWGK